MEADMIRAEAEWQAQEIIAQARRHAAERIAGADSRLAELNQAENRVMDRLAGVGQVLAEALADAADQPSDGATPAASRPSPIRRRSPTPTPTPTTTGPAARSTSSSSRRVAGRAPLPTPEPENDCHSGGHPRTPGVRHRLAKSDEP